jgi:hypothetical protein|tara:strand:- start:3884 stop:4036 length:153 start_codon:yes stop_codon:yes gene_type:complete
MEDEFLFGSGGEYIYIKIDISKNPKCSVCDGKQVELEGGRFLCPNCTPFA